MNVEHEEVLLVPRWIDCRRVTFKYGLGDEFIDVLKTLRKLGLDRDRAARAWTGCEVSPARRRRGRAARPDDPRRQDDRQDLRGHVGDRDGHGRRRRGRSTCYHVVDNEETWARDGAQAVVWQTAINPVIALELLATGAWSGAGVLGPEAFEARPVPDLLKTTGRPGASRSVRLSR